MAVQSAKGCTSCLGMAIKSIFAMLLSSFGGWIAGKLTTVVIPAVVVVLGAGTVRETPWLVALALAVIPFGTSFVMALAVGLLFNRRSPQAA